MMPSPPIDDSYDTCHSRWIATGHDQVSHPCPGLARNGPAIPVMQRDDHVLTPTHSPWICSKPTAAAAFVRHLQAQPRG